MARKACDTISDARGSIARYICFDDSKRPDPSLDRQTPDQAYFARLPQIAAAWSQQRPTYREQNAVHPTEPALSDVPTFHVRAQLILSMTQQHWLPLSVYSSRYHERRNYTDRA
jgi:hypothetical protein